MPITLDGTSGITATDGLVYTRGNILGTVSQSAGVPTGSILEKGSNVNGEYVKYADGTMICWIDNAGSVDATSATGSIFRTAADATWTFPATFSVAPVTSGQAASTSVSWLMLAAPTTTSVGFRQCSSITSAAAVITRLLAIGRWY